MKFTTIQDEIEKEVKKIAYSQARRSCKDLAKKYAKDNKQVIQLVVDLYIKEVYNNLDLLSILERTTKKALSEVEENFTLPFRD